METKEKLEYQDLLYFGYDFSEEAAENRQLQIDFIKEIKERFSEVALEDAYDNIKGFRQEVYLPKKENNNYYSWLIGKGWFEMSLGMQLLIMSASTDNEKKETFNKYVSLAKEQYPESFKK
jgi:hypothetical protein